MLKPLVGRLVGLHKVLGRVGGQRRNPAQLAPDADWAAADLLELADSRDRGARFEGAEMSRLTGQVLAAALAVVAASAGTREPGVQDEQMMVLAPGTAPEVKVLVMVTDHPPALAVLIAGDGGAMGFSGRNGMVMLNQLGLFDFAMRARNTLFKHDVAVIATDAPSGQAMRAADREGSTRDALAMIEQVRQRLPAVASVPLWAIGNREGGISAAALAVAQPLVTLVLAHPAPQGFGRAADLRCDRLDRRPLRRVLVLGLEHHAHRPLDDLGGKLRGLPHDGSIFSNEGTSSNPGAVHHGASVGA
jgi:hypothetical protein